MDHSDKAIAVALCTILFAFSIIEIIIAAVVYGTRSLEIFSPLNNLPEIMILLLTSGVFAIICSAIGGAGFVKNNKKIFLVFIAAAFANSILQVVGFKEALSTDVLSEAFDLLKRLRNLYDPSEPNVQRVWDDMQERLHCCGFFGPEEWGTNYPDSCCVDGNCSTQNAYKDGCFSVAEFYFSFLVNAVLAGFSAAITFLQLILGVLAYKVLRQDVNAYIRF
ncbi:Hypothetical predicted protein [Cloeon dipterum]|uniref:Tetraspanin n=1 Tax=Cloeon dipterum TaxID=197152 RepID=A0A8S1CBS2_9INSE|nr:Hypothetical predicted protein [Cloeon dipterum]